MIVYTKSMTFPAALLRGGKFSLFLERLMPSHLIRRYTEEAKWVTVLADVAMIPKQTVAIHSYLNQHLRERKGGSV